MIFLMLKMKFYGKIFDINSLKEFFLKLENIYQSFLNEYIEGGGPRWFLHRVISQLSEALYIYCLAQRFSG